MKSPARTRWLVAIAILLAIVCFLMVRGREETRTRPTHNFDDHPREESARSRTATISIARNEGDEPAGAPDEDEEHRGSLDRILVHGIVLENRVPVANAI